MNTSIRKLYDTLLERINQPRVKYRAGWTAIALFIFALFYAGVAAESNAKNKERGTTCTRQLSDIDRALFTITELKNISNSEELTQAIGPAPYEGLNPYLNGYKINGPAGKSSSLRCPVGGVYSIPGTINSTDRHPGDPVCSLAVKNPAAYRATYLHSLKAIP